MKYEGEKAKSYEGMRQRWRKEEEGGGEKGKERERKRERKRERGREEHFLCQKPTTHARTILPLHMCVHKVPNVWIQQLQRVRANLHEEPRQI